MYPDVTSTYTLHDKDEKRNKIVYESHKHLVLESTKQHKKATHKR
jgi:hypothetical protein